jgi:hypothetical protein
MPVKYSAVICTALDEAIVRVMTLATVTVPQALEQVAELPEMGQVAAPETSVHDPLDVVPAVNVAPETDAPEAITSELEHVPPAVMTSDVSAA